MRFSPAQISKISILTTIMIFASIFTNCCYGKNTCIKIKRDKVKKIFIYKQKDKIKVKVSCFNPQDPHQTGSKKRLTSSGYNIQSGDKVIAVSPDLIKKFPMNSVIQIQGVDGNFIVKDTMAKSKKNSIDIAIFDKDLSLKENKKKALQFGVKNLYITKIVKNSKI